MHKHKGNWLGQLTEPKLVVAHMQATCRSRFLKQVAVQPASHANLLVQGSNLVPNSSAGSGPPRPRTGPSVRFSPNPQPRTPDQTSVWFGKVRVRTTVQNQTVATLPMLHAAHLLSTVPRSSRQVSPGAETTGHAQIMNAFRRPFMLEGLFGESDAEAMDANADS